MSQQSKPDPATPAGDATTTEAPSVESGAAAAAEPAIERSRFSQWLASFGLGELQNPLLTRARPPVPKRRS
jgi:hypothetical protein